MISQSAFLYLCLALISALLTPTVESHELRSVEQGQNEVPEKHNDSRRRRLVTCNNPSTVPYDAQVHLATYKTISSCTSAETAFVGERIRYHWERYITFNPQFGTVVLDIEGDVCTSQNRRLMHRNGTLSLDDGRELNFYEGEINWFFRIGGGCFWCPEDNSDNRRSRRLSSTVPVTFQFQTDNWPEEMWFKIKDKWGIYVVTHRDFWGATPNSEYEVTYDLIPGETYEFYKKDRYGDGWCCWEGHGGVKIFDGIPANGMDLIAAYSGDFGRSEMETFTVPALGVTARSAGWANPADILFPELESGLSDYISYYIQQEFHNDAASCLHNAAPTVWIDLEQAQANAAPLSC